MNKKKLKAEIWKGFLSIIALYTMIIAIGLVEELTGISLIAEEKPILLIMRTIIILAGFIVLWITRAKVLTVVTTNILLVVLSTMIGDGDLYSSMSIFMFILLFAEIIPIYLREKEQGKD